MAINLNRCCSTAVPYAPDFYLTLRETRQAIPSTLNNRTVSYLFHYLSQFFSTTNAEYSNSQILSRRGYCEIPLYSFPLPDCCAYRGNRCSVFQWIASSYHLRCFRLLEGWNSLQYCCEAAARARGILQQNIRPSQRAVSVGDENIKNKKRKYVSYEYVITFKQCFKPFKVIWYRYVEQKLPSVSEANIDKSRPGYS